MNDKVKTTERGDDKRSHDISTEAAFKAPIANDNTVFRDISAGRVFP